MKPFLRGAAVAASLQFSLGADGFAQVPALKLDRPAWTASASFTFIESVRELRNGAVLVSDSDDRSVHLVSPGGGTRVIGRTGSGPREYTTPTALLPLPGDSTALIDRDARRYITISPDGTLLDAKQFPQVMGNGAEFVSATDLQGRFYFQPEGLAAVENAASSVAIKRWDPRNNRIDNVATVRAPNPQPVKMAVTDAMKSDMPGLQSLVARRVMPFTPEDDWAVAPSGRVAIVRADPYRVDWIEVDGRVSSGGVVTYRPIAVTDADKKRREPKGPPYRFTYPATKPAFAPGVFVDDRDNVWVRREGPAGASRRSWDVFSATGARVGDISLPAQQTFVAITRRFVYVARTDDDGLRWLEAYSR